MNHSSSVDLDVPRFLQDVTVCDRLPSTVTVPGAERVVHNLDSQSEKFTLDSVKFVALGDV